MFRVGGPGRGSGGPGRGAHLADRLDDGWAPGPAVVKEAVVLPEQRGGGLPLRGARQVEQDVPRMFGVHLHVARVGRREEGVAGVGEDLRVRGAAVDGEGGVYVGLDGECLPQAIRVAGVPVDGEDEVADIELLGLGRILVLKAVLHHRLHDERLAVLLDPAVACQRVYVRNLGMERRLESSLMPALNSIQFLRRYRQILQF